MDDATTIIVIDDDPDGRLVLRLAIDAAGASFRWAGEAADAFEGMSLWRMTRPDIVLIDHGLPEIDGLTIARAIRDRDPDQAIVLCSAAVTSELVRRAHDVGIRQCLAKTELHRLPELLHDTARVVGPA